MKRQAMRGNGFPKPKIYVLISSYWSVQFSWSVVSNSLRPHGLQHTRLPCPLPTPGAYSNSCPLSWWCHLTIFPSVVPFSSYLQSFPASGSLMSQLFPSGGQSIGASASASVLPMNIQDWFPLGLNTGVGCHSLLQGIFPTQGLNPGLLNCRRILYHLSHQRSP